ncbi:DNA-binding response regulator [Betaproteobacteria bacterium]|nr:DNA-binding response regulator [Betaproteobacteria bacterium]GHU01612.1 DNA-binding response regulator [Betaproteobacteria bacterium]GHU09954.1 DNA-binding response regulator [Betaproteobacteria bacterium]GHU24131.1 DNA-binding response regulator [Betaproteobacteria bacterium]GHU30409.1 DNA-binding response regulator [Betaproteobacteria bacterium]
MKPRVLVVEDQLDIADLILLHLQHEGFEAVATENGVGAQREIDAVLPDLILLDWMLPGGQSGIDLARKWRAAQRTRNVPIIILTARGAEADKITGLDSGGDDYITKPFSPAELMARIRALLRRRAPEQLADVVTVGELTLDAGELRVRYRNHDIPLGPTEFRLLHYLMKHPDRVYSRASLLDKVWGDHVFIEERTVDVHIKRLRAALRDAGTIIETVRGAGYRLVSKQNA